jgi:hypothetical protein
MPSYFYLMILAFISPPFPNKQLIVNPRTADVISLILLTSKFDVTNQHFTGQHKV